jgi:DNA topoisomerase-2
MSHTLSHPHAGAAAASSSAASTDHHLAKTYQKKNDRQHILDAPDTYIGSVEEDTATNWTYDPDAAKMEYRSYRWVPGLYKCFDEGIVNARDHHVRMNQKAELGVADIQPVKNIEITVDRATGVITMLNDGNGIDVVKHPEHDLWIPEMIFGHLRTSTNYNKEETRIVGGKNGFGFKLVLIYSTWGAIETVDHTRGLKYVQEFHDNLGRIDPPKITKVKGKPYTKVSFRPDFARFGLAGITDDMFALFYKRALDIAAVTDKTVKVKFNDAPLPVRSFEDYVNLYVGGKTDAARVYERTDDGRWEYAVALSPLDEFAQVSFVNGIYTSKGGKHVEYILGQITRKLVDFIEKKKKIKVKPATIKEQLMLFINCVVENPSFESQTKDEMSTPAAKFGSRVDISEKFIDKVAKLGVMDTALSLNEVKDTEKAKKTDGRKTTTVRGIPKLSDANYAGTAKSGECTLILCEGDSAKAGIISGLSTTDRNFIGVYPLKGKLMNVRDATAAKVGENAEIADLKKILGLETGKKYATPEAIAKSLRYGKVLFMTDQDLDGSHIKGLCINLFNSQWNDLIRAGRFMGFMNTPILKASKGGTTISFYNEKEYEDWKTTTPGHASWTIKYYKGLGTSTGAEFKEYFRERKVVDFLYEGASCDEALDMVFRKTRANDRKEWLAGYDKEHHLDTTKREISYSEFVHGELIHFSKYDCERSIPNLVDGLKTSLRKILYCAFKRRLTSEVKVAQFGGYVSEHSGYHHGEASLMNAIKGMAQDFVGSNNINLLAPNGQFGTRLKGGDDAASERYIFTKLMAITRTIFPEADDPVLHYLDDDGQRVEPEFYVPILPMVLVNGSRGIGTGFSTDVVSYNPRQIVAYLKAAISEPGVDAAPPSPDALAAACAIEPYFEGFRGAVLRCEDPTKYIIKGVYEAVPGDADKIRITELPVGTWTEDYKALLEKLMDGAPASGAGSGGGGGSSAERLVKDYVDLSTDVKIDITVTLVPGAVARLTAKVHEGGHFNDLEKQLGLTTSVRTTNMHMFDAKQRLRKYATPYEIIQEYIPVRMECYQRRKDYQVAEMERKVMILSNRARFIEEQCDGVLDLRRKKKEVVIEELRSRGYATLPDDTEFKYLRSMSFDSLVEENIALLRKERDEMMSELEILRGSSCQSLWRADLEAFEAAYEEYVVARKEKETAVGTSGGETGGKGTRKKIVKKVPVTAVVPAAATAPGLAPAPAPATNAVLTSTAMMTASPSKPLKRVIRVSK